MGGKAWGVIRVTLAVPNTWVGGRAWGVIRVTLGWGFHAVLIRDPVIRRNVRESL